MKVYIKQAKVLVPNSEWNGKKCDVVIEDGLIKEIANKINQPEGSIKIEHDDLHLSLGWFDFRAHYCDPGMEYKEELLNGLDTAAKGGFTGVATLPSTDPVVDSKADVQYILNKASRHMVDVFPIGAITQGQKGEELAEMFDMSQAGAIAFTDDKKPILRTDLVRLALQYSDNINGLIMLHPEDTYISKGGQMNEGPSSTKTALKGMPNLSEALTIARNIQLCEYAESRLHISTVSTKEGVALIRKAKADGLNITADVAAYNLYFNDEVLESYDSNYKVNPPIRSEEDRKVLIEAVLDGTIDVISSDHRPQDVEHKNCEFSIASFGMVSQETFLHMIGALPLEKAIASFTTKPRAIYGIEQPSFEVTAEANITLFNLSDTADCKANELTSMSKNTPFLGQELKGKVMATICNDSVEIY